MVNYKLYKVNIANAERIFKRAIEVLEGKMPKASEECGFCKWVREVKK